MQLTITNDTMRKVNSLPDDKRAKVIQIVKRHLKACAKNGCPTESMDRVYLEAIDVAEMKRNSRRQKRTLSVNGKCATTINTSVRKRHKSFG